MSDPIKLVRPGDLITADLMNDVLSKLAELELRLSRIEGGSGASGKQMTITDLRPRQNVYQVGQELQIFGTNFRFSERAHRVYFDSVRVPDTAFDQQLSSDERLVLSIPNIPGLSEEERDVVLTVSNTLETLTRTIQLRQAPSVSGNFDLQWTQVEPAQISAGAAATWRYRLRSRAPTTTVTLAATISLPGVQSQLRFLGPDRQPLSNNQLRLATRQEVEFFVHLPQIPTNIASNTTFTLTVTASAPDVPSATSSEQFTVGQTTIPPDNSIRLSINSVAPANVFNSSTNTVTLAQGVVATVNLNAEFTMAGTYNLTPRLIPPATGWTVVLADTPSQYVVEENDLTAGSFSRGPRFRIRPDAGATTPAQVEFVIQRTGSTSSQSLTFNLIRA